MTVTFRVTPAMHYRVRRALAWQLPSVRIAYALAAIFPCVVIGLVVAGGESLAEALRTLGYPLTAFILVWVALVPLLNRWSAARRLRSYPGLQGEIAYSFGEESIECKSAVATGTVSWSAYIRAVENKEFIFLFVNKTMANFIPKAAFADAGALAEMRALVARKLGAKAAPSFHRPA
jgi:hypothetical protein